MLQPNSTASNTTIDRPHDYQLFASVLKSCAALSAVNRGRTLHSALLKLGHLSCHYVSKSLLNMYAKSATFADCLQLFDEMRSSTRDPVIWNILLSGFSASRTHDVQTLTFFNRMVVFKGVKPTSVTAAIVLPVCARYRDVSGAKCLHGYLIKSGIDTCTLVGNALVSVYAKCGLVCSDGYAAFCSIREKDVISWNAIIAGFSENKMFNDAFRLFVSMLESRLKPNHATIANILPVVVTLDPDTTYWLGKEMQGYAVRHELLADVSVCNAFLSFYFMVERVTEAELLFQSMEQRDSVSWNAIISGYASNGEWSKSMKVFRELLSLELSQPDSVTFVSILPVCVQLKNLKAGREIHGYLLRHPYLCLDTSVGNVLVSFYAKFGKLNAAYHAFLMIPNKDLISWNSILDAFTESGHNAHFSELLQGMHREGIRPDSVTILTILHFCANVLQVGKVKETHCYSLRCGLLVSDGEPTTRNAILDAYAKCGDIDYAFKVFQSSPENRNLVTFNSMIAGYVNSGLYDDASMIFEMMSTSDLTTWNLMVRGFAANDCPEQAFSLFRQLQAKGMKPDEVTIMSILPACAQMASLHLMKQCHGYVVRACFNDTHLQGALLDVYAKCGNIDYAFGLFNTNLVKDLVIFTSMVGGYAMHGMGKEALGIFSEIVESGVKPDHVVITAVLSACCHAGLVNEGLMIFNSIEEVHGMRPTLEQYSCVVDLLARGGRIEDAYSLVTKMPVEANATVWGALLGACRLHHEVELGDAVAERLFKIETDNIGNYVVLSNLFAAVARWDEVTEIRKQLRIRDLKKPAGCSWIELDNTKNVFTSGDHYHPQRSNIYNLLSTLDMQIKQPFQSNQLL